MKKHRKKGNRINNIKRQKNEKIPVTTIAVIAVAVAPLAMPRVVIVSDHKKMPKKGSF
jgi:hypothetical protein